MKPQKFSQISGWINRKLIAFAFTGGSFSLVSTLARQIFFFKQWTSYVCCQREYICFHRLVAPAGGGLVGGAGLTGLAPAAAAASKQPVAAWTLCDLPHRPTLMISKHHTQLHGFGGSEVILSCHLCLYVSPECQKSTWIKDQEER